MGGGNIDRDLGGLAETPPRHTLVLPLTSTVFKKQIPAQNANPQGEGVTSDN